MEQKDYLLREIEKIGLLLRMLIDKITHTGDNAAIILEHQFEETNELMIQEIGFDVDLFLRLNITEVEQYLTKFTGFRAANIELLADFIKEMGTRLEPEVAKKYLERALKLYEICNSLDKTFSFERENKINQIKNCL
jgi:hypothetical protein